MKKNMQFRLVALITSVLLTGCDSSEVSIVKKMTVPQDQTHTYETALSNRATCETSEWRTFKDNANREAVEYLCVLKNGAELLAAKRAWQIKEIRSEFQNYYQAMDQRIEEAKQHPAFLEKRVVELQEKLAQAQAQEAQADKENGDNDPVRAMRRAAVRNEMGAVASAKFSAERTEQSLLDAKANMEENLASLQREKERFQEDEKNALARIEKSYGGVVKATEVFQWSVKGEEVFPAWSGVKLQKQDGAIISLNTNWGLTIRDLLHYRGDDHVRYALDIPGGVVLGQLNAPKPEAAHPIPNPGQQPGSSKETCYQVKLKDFRKGMGEESPVNNEMMNEWRAECGLPAV